MLKKKVIEKVELSFKGCPVVEKEPGDAELIERCDFFLMANDQGQIEYLRSMKQVYDMHPTWLQRIDKSGFRFFGIDRESGNVIVAFALYKEDEKGKPFEHYYFKEAKDCDPWNI